MDFEKAKERIWTRHEHKSGIPLTKGFRRAVEENLGGTPDEPTYLEDLDNLIADYMKVIKELPPTRTSALSGSNTEKSSHKIYRKCLERRFYLVDFVVEKGLKERTARIDWKRTATAWNEAHPSDSMSLPVLKAEYYRALHEPTLKLQYFVTVMAKVAKSYTKFFQDTIYSPDSWVSLYYEHNRGAMETMETDFNSFFKEAINMLHSSPTSEFSKNTSYRLLYSLFLSLKAQIKDAQERLAYKMSREASHEGKHKQEVSKQLHNQAKSRSGPDNGKAPAKERKRKGNA